MPQAQKHTPQEHWHKGTRYQPHILFLKPWLVGTQDEWSVATPCRGCWLIHTLSLRHVGQTTILMRTTRTRIAAATWEGAHGEHD